MRGGPPRPSMKLDNRPKKLLVKGASEDKQQALKDWYEVCITVPRSFPESDSSQITDHWSIGINRAWRK